MTSACGQFRPQGRNHRMFCLHLWVVMAPRFAACRLRRARRFTGGRRPDRPDDLILSTCCPAQLQLADDAFTRGDDLLRARPVCSTLALDALRQLRDHAPHDNAGEGDDNGSEDNPALTEVTCMRSSGRLVVPGTASHAGEWRQGTE
jgi:hypothetical protein